MSRPVVSYDDIAAPKGFVTSQPTPQTLPMPSQPLAKKRKTNQKPTTARRSQQQYPQHWDDPGSSAEHMTYGEAPVANNAAEEEGEYEDGEEEEDESRGLTHEEIWDDSALIEAWDSAMAEYEAYHGPGKKWKAEPIKKSPLWYNVPPKTQKKATKQPAGAALTYTTAAATAGSPNDDSAEGDSTPLNFDTFVPSHDPSLAVATAGLMPADGFTAAAPTMVGRDEAFQRAMSAIYWTGYWTAVYHYQRSAASGEEGDGGVEEEEETDEPEEDLVPAQR